MKITVCDMCGEQGSERKLNKWVEIRWADGILAKFELNKKQVLEVCAECFYAIRKECNMRYEIRRLERTE